MVDRSGNGDRLLIKVEEWTILSQNNIIKKHKRSRKNNFKWLVFFLLGVRNPLDTVKN